MKQEKIGNEDYDWTKDIPGIIQMEVAPEYWVTLHENFQESESDKRLSGFLTLLIGTFTDANNMYDFNALLEKFEELIPQSKKNNRLSMLTLYYLYNEIVPEDVRRPNYVQFVKRHENELLEPNIQSIILHTLADDDFPYNIDNALGTYETYCTKKYSKNGLQVPTILEIAIIIKIANKFNETGNKTKYHELYNKAILDLTNFSDLQNKILNADKNEISFNVNDILRPNMKQLENNNQPGETLY